MDPSNAQNLWLGGATPGGRQRRDGWTKAGAVFRRELPDGDRGREDGLELGPDGNAERLHLPDDDGPHEHGVTTVWGSDARRADERLQVLGRLRPGNTSVAYATYRRSASSTSGRRSTRGDVGVDHGAGVTGIPDIPVDTIVVDPTNSSRLYVGTDLGVFTSIDGGANWKIENSGFANVPTDALRERVAPLRLHPRPWRLPCRTRRRNAGSGGELHLHAGDPAARPDRPVHRYLHELADFVVVELRDGATSAAQNPAHRLYGLGDLHGLADGEQLGRLRLDQPLAHRRARTRLAADTPRPFPGLATNIVLLLPDASSPKGRTMRIQKVAPIVLVGLVAVPLFAREAHTLVARPARTRAAGVRWASA